MTTAQSAEKAIREALAAGPTPGPWTWELEPSPSTDMGRLVNLAGEEVCNFGDCRAYEETSGVAPISDDKKFIAAANPAALTALLDELERLRRDAERYQWLRGGRARTTGSPKEGRIEIMQWEGRSEANVLKGTALDEAIDAAMKENRA